MFYSDCSSWCLFVTFDQTMMYVLFCVFCLKYTWLFDFLNCEIFTSELNWCKVALAFQVFVIVPKKLLNIKFCFTQVKPIVLLIRPDKLSSRCHFGPFYQLKIMGSFDDCKIVFFQTTSISKQTDEYIHRTSLFSNAAQQTLYYNYH